ncbi:MAG: glycosyltransferase family 39 protein [Verrucomicrobia bacterium]|nr:glycosyltransferase family 39 protein [Verrucomicrobiota bacterium]
MIVAIGVVCRLIGLGNAGVPGDELEIWKWLQSGPSAFDILSGKVSHPNMFALLPGYTRAVQELLGLPLTRFTLRMPSALLGAAAIPILFFCGRILAGRRGGLIAAALLAINPVHIQCSRETYPYVLSTTGGCLCLWALLSMMRCVGQEARVRWWSYILMAIGFYMMLNSSIAAWPVVITYGSLLLLGAGLKAWCKPRDVKAIIITVVIGAILCLPRMLPQLLKIFGQKQAQAAQAGGKTHGADLFDPQGLTFFQNFSWGSTVLRTALLCAVLLLALAWLWQNRRRWPTWTPCLVLTIGFLTTMVSRYSTGNSFLTRFLVPLLPVYQLLLAVGFCYLLQSKGPVTRIRYQRPAGWMLLALALLLQLHPASLAMKMEGHPYPYARIVDWADANLPPGTPVLCDRFFDAFNEFKVNAPTNVVFTSTILNEPKERYQQTNWRGTAQAFLLNNPDAAFYEAKMLWPHVGKWDWPHGHFANRISFIDEPFMALRRLGLNYRFVGTMYTDEEWGRAIYYNTWDDLKRRAEKASSPALVSFGPGWTYTKTGDYRDWRAMGHTAYCRIANLANVPLRITLTVQGAAAQGAKTVSVGGGHAATFPANQLSQQSLGPFLLEPGDHMLQFDDANWPQRQTPLLVQRIVVSAASADL